MFTNKLDYHNLNSYILRHRHVESFMQKLIQRTK